MQSSTEEHEVLRLSEGLDEQCDIVDYPAELSEDDEEEQRVREGQLLQLSQAPSENFCFRIMSRILKAVNLSEYSSSEDVPVGDRHLISHDHVTTITPELAALIASEMRRFSKSIKERTSKNIQLLETLLAKVPDGQTTLERHVDGILSNEQKIQKEVESMERFANDLKNGDIIAKDGAWLKTKERY